METSMVVRDYLQRLDDQREALFRDLNTAPEAQLWSRPQPKKWSAGEHLDHTRVFNRFFRRVCLVLWPILLPIAKLRRGRAYATEIDNVYERPSMPTSVGVLWSPYYRSDRPTSVANLHRALAQEHGRLGDFFGDKVERLLGNAYLWDPAIGWLNYIQALRVGIYHDQHHYAAVRRLLEL